MKIFNRAGKWKNKVNFVDDNNVLLGFSDEDGCCARGGWFLSDTEKAWDEETFKEENMELPGWAFDTDYFRDRGLSEQPGSSEYDEGGAVQFRLKNGDKEKFLTLYNHHNGYYSRGFKFEVGGKVIRESGV